MNDHKDENDIYEYSHVDEVMDWITTIILALFALVGIAGLAGFIWGMT